MSDVLSAVRLGPWVVFQDEDGRRHAVRQSSILAVSDVDGMSTWIQFTGGRQVVAREDFETVMEWVV
jgi:hypothetical protein